MAVATALYAAGADVNLPAANAAAGFGGAGGLTPLMAAATVGSFELLAWLLAHGSRPFLRSRGAGVAGAAGSVGCVHFVRGGC